jgi:hypothetical protein
MKGKRGCTALYNSALDCSDIGGWEEGVGYFGAVSFLIKSRSRSRSRSNWRALTPSPGAYI